MAEVRAGSWRKNGEAVFRLVPRGKGNAMRSRLSERQQAPALHSGASPQSPAHFGVRRLATALSPRELTATSERSSLRPGVPGSRRHIVTRSARFFAHGLAGKIAPNRAQTCAKEKFWKNTYPKMQQDSWPRVCLIFRIVALTKSAKRRIL
jgi:hypothetical protein